jgi:6-phosphogluconate dehydrogenase
MANIKKQEFGLVGLGVMGRNFILNVAEKGFSVIGVDLDLKQVEHLRSEGEHLPNLMATHIIADFAASLSTPRKIMLLVPAGEPVDLAISGLLPFLHKGDCIVDGGNSHFVDTERRINYLQEKGIHFLGVGVSGGAEGARKGPSIMPGGNPTAYKQFAPIFEAVAAKYDKTPCVAYLGGGASGNYVKMIHNGIEYAMMELIAEVYDLLKSCGHLDNTSLQNTFENWNEGRLASYLVEITASIFEKKDPLTPGYLLDVIQDTAKQKGTGKWTSQHALDLGIPIPSIDAAVGMRAISAQKGLRQAISSIFGKPQPTKSGTELIEACESALYFGFITAYAQGLYQLSEASKALQYELNLGTIAKIWRAGCIIRSEILNEIVHAFNENPQLEHLYLAPGLNSGIQEAAEAGRRMAILALENGVPTPTLLASIAYFDALKSNNLSTRLIQAQRDFFGAHTYERTDRIGIFHTDWEVEK